MSISRSKERYTLLNPRPKHFEQIQELCKRVYPYSKPWSIDQLESHRAYFPEGQLIVVDNQTNQVIGMAFSLIILWDDYLSQDNWQDFTGGGYFHNHNPRFGKTLYGAEVMVDPTIRGQGIGKMLYEGRKKIVEKYKLKRIRAGSRLRGYSEYKDKLSATEYVKEVSEKKIYDPTLSFQINQGFKTLRVAPNYLTGDPESLGYAAVIEWLNPKIATQKDKDKQNESINSFFQGHKFTSKHLPRELRRLVRQSTLVLGKVIKSYEGDKFYNKLEYYRDQLKKTRSLKNSELLSKLLTELRSENKNTQLQLAHAFSLQLELVNICESAYRTWRQHAKPVPQDKKIKTKLTFVLTAHPTEARSKIVVKILRDLEKILMSGIQSDFLFNENELANKVRMLWLNPLSKNKSPEVVDEADYIYSIIFNEELFDFILLDKPSYEIILRTWVGGDKDGHPGVNKDVMMKCLSRSRKYILEILIKKIEKIHQDASCIQHHSIPINEMKGLIKLISDLKNFENISYGDGSRIKAWVMKYHRFIKSTGLFITEHSQTSLIRRILEIFPALVFPIELREDSSLIKKGLLEKNSIIAGMLTELTKTAGALSVTTYARSLIISNCESMDDLDSARKLIAKFGNRILPIVPLFETKPALMNAKNIITQWLDKPVNFDLVKNQWSGVFEVMLGYSDSAKQSGALASRFLIAKAMHEIEKTISEYNLKPIFFHGSGGSVARGGGSLTEQISWWSNAAVANPKVTVQGEMIQRKFANREILRSQCLHLTTEALKRKVNFTKWKPHPLLEKFALTVQENYSALVNDPVKLNILMEASPYKFLELLKFGSRPSKRPQQTVSVSSLRAIPWVLCWTQTRLLMPVWWGVGSAWRDLSVEEKKELKLIYKTSPFLSSFVKTLGFTLAKVELEVWKMYFGKNKQEELFKSFKTEFASAVKFVHEMSEEKTLIWHRPWLEESIKLRASNVHVLNLLQILSLENTDEALLKETIVGIACGMLTTG